MKIITHPGKAHYDEYLSVAVLIAHYDNNTVNTTKTKMEVYRRNPTNDELDDADITIVDIGFRYNTDLGNVDHHQDDENVKGHCTLSLINEHLRLRLELLPRYKQVVLQDTKGVPGVIDNIKNGGDLATHPIGTYDLVQFEAYSGDEAIADEIVQRMRKIGKWILGEVKTVAIDIARLKDDMHIDETRNGLKVLSFPNETNMRNSFALANDIKANIRICSGNRNPGYTVYVYGNVIDLNTLPAEMFDFVHKNGFIGNVKKKYSIDDIIKALSEKELIAIGDISDAEIDHV